MSIASENGFKGYNFQGSVYSYLIFLMDLERKITEVDAEKPVDNNFDDLYVKTLNDSFFFQVKNYTEIEFDKIKFEQDKIKISSRKDINVKSKSGFKNNVLVLKDLVIPEDKITDEVFGFKCYKVYDYYVTGYVEDDINFIIREKYSNDIRYSDILNLASKVINSGSFKFELKNLPPLSIFNQKLEKETITIRDFNIETNENILFIVGKPGVGKSHLVDELENKKIIDNYVLERLWISEKDKNKKDRREYNEFIKDLSYKLFNKAEVESEKSIIEFLKESKKTLIIDGLDHVENYNKEDIEKFFNFIDCIKDSKVIVLTRPLDHDIPYKQVELENWSEDECVKYINARGIAEYKVSRQIFKITKGYPIITYFLCEHYIIYGEIPKLDEIESLNDFYDSIINKAYNGLSVFLINTSYFKFSDLEIILSPLEFSMINDVINNNKYLFSIDRDRIFLIHDSLNLYLRTKVPNYIEVNENSISKICELLNSEDIRFISRFGNICIPNEFAVEYTKKMCKFEKIKELLFKTIDYEAIADFVFSLGNVIHKNHCEFCLEEYYTYILLNECFIRDNHGGFYDLLCERILYYIKNKLIEYDNIYSTGLLYYIYSCFIDKSYEPLRKYYANTNFDTEGEISNFSEALDERTKYFSILNENINIEEYLNEKIIGSEIHDRDAIIKLICYLYIHNEKYNDFEKIAFYIIDEKQDEIAIKSLSDIFVSYNIRNFFAKSSINKIRDYLFSLGVDSSDNYYKYDSLKSLIIKKSHLGTFELSNYLSNYIRLASYENRKIDYDSLGLFYYLYYQRKDYSVINLPIALIIFFRKGFIDCKKCVEVLSLFMSMSEKGIRTIMTDFFELMTLDEFEKNIEYINNDIHIEDLSIDKINLIDDELLIKYFMDKIFSYHLPTKNIEYLDIKNFVKSKIRSFVISTLKYANFSIDGIQIDEINFETYNPTHEDERKKFTDRDWIYEDDSQNIIDNNISCIELARYHDGWYSALPYPNLFDIYEKKEIQDNIKEIIDNATFNIKNDYNYSTRYLMIGNILKMLDDYEIEEVNWDNLYKSLNDFIELSTLKK